MTPGEAKTVLDFIEGVEITSYENECVDYCGGVGADSHESECRWMAARDIMQRQIEGIDNAAEEQPPQAVAQSSCCFAPIGQTVFDTVCSKCGGIVRFHPSDLPQLVGAPVTFKDHEGNVTGEAKVSSVQVGTGNRERYSDSEDDQLHPNGQCTCAGEGKCDWCKRTFPDPQRFWRVFGHEPQITLDGWCSKCANNPPDCVCLSNLDARAAAAELAAEGQPPHLRQVEHDAIAQGCTAVIDLELEAHSNMIACVNPECGWSKVQK